MKFRSCLELRGKCSQAGFSLVELAITMGVVVLCLAGYLGANIAIQKSGQASFERMLAVQDASRVIEQMRNTAENGQFPGNVTAVFPNGANPGGFNNLPQQQVTVNYADPNANPLDVTVRVNWMSQGRRPVNTALRTLITQRAR